MGHTFPPFGIEGKEISRCGKILTILARGRSGSVDECGRGQREDLGLLVCPAIAHEDAITQTIGDRIVETPYPSKDLNP